MAGVDGQPKPEWVPLATWEDGAGVVWARVRWADGRVETRRVKVSVEAARIDARGNEQRIEVQGVKFRCESL